MGKMNVAFIYSTLFCGCHSDEQSNGVLRICHRQRKLIRPGQTKLRRAQPACCCEKSVLHFLPTSESLDFDNEIFA